MIDDKQSDSEGLPAVVTAGLVVVVVGVGVAFDPWGWNGYLSLKILYAGAGLGLILVACGWRSRLIVPVGIMPAAGLALVGLMAVSSLLSESVWRSLLGAPFRMEGLLAWLGFAGAFIAGFSIRRWNASAAAGSLVRVCIAAVGLVGIAGLLELAGFELDSDLIEFHGRTRSTLGNPAVLAGFLLLAGPVAATALLWRSRWRWAGGVGAALALVGLLAAQSRAAWLATVLVAVALRLCRGSGRPWILIAGLPAVGAASILTGRWHDVISDFGERAAIWRVAVSVIGDRPFVGVGPEMFMVAFGEHLSDSTARQIGSTAVVDRAHSGILDFTASYGLGAGLIYAVLLVVVGAVALRAMRGGDWFGAALGAGILAYGLQQQLFFAHAAVDGVWWLMIGFLVADTEVTSAALRGPASLVVVAVVAAVALNAASVFRNDRMYSGALGARVPADAYESLVAAESHRPFDDTSYLLMGQLLGRVDDPVLVDRGLGRLGEGAARLPGNEFAVLGLSDALLNANRLTGDVEFASRAVRNLTEFIDRHPSNGRAHLARGIAHYRLGQRAEARSDWERAGYLMPEHSEVEEYIALLD